MALWFVSATRETREAFDRKAPLARSLARVSGSSPFVLAVAYANTLPLPDVYNRAIDAAGADDTLVFVHDDVWIDDWRIASPLDEALAAYRRSLVLYPKRFNSLVGAMRAASMAGQQTLARQYAKELMSVAGASSRRDAIAEARRLNSSGQ